MGQKKFDLNSIENCAIFFVAIFTILLIGTLLWVNLMVYGPEVVVSTICGWARFILAAAFGLGIIMSRRKKSIEYLEGDDF
jgi:hypothetical protein